MHAKPSAAAPAAADDDSEEADDDDAPAAKPAPDKDKAKDKPAPATAVVPAAPPAAAAAPAEPPAQTAASPLTVQSGGWTASMYGFAELDMMGDSTQSFAESVNNLNVARPNTVAGDNPRVQLTARNSRLGFRIAAPEYNSIKASAVVEMDFFAEEPPTLRQNDAYTAGPVRMRHYYAKLETPIIDVLAGQYHDLFAWGGAGFYPNSVAFLPLLGEIYHRNPQLRLSKTFKSSAADFEIAAAAVRPAQRDAGAPDVEAGLRLAVNGWRGASAPGAARPVAAPMALGVSAIARRLSVTDFSTTPGNPHTATAGGIAANIFLPIVPARGEDLSNNLSFTAEYTTGTGIADLYPGLTGGVGFPALPDPNNTVSVPTYLPNIDPGLATYDAADTLHTINWRGLVLNAHYHLPISDGKKVWVSGTYSMLQSNNALEFTPIQGRDFVWHTGQYIDANLWWGVTPAVQVGLSFQNTRQQYGDGTIAKNNRGEGAFYFFF